MKATAHDFIYDTVNKQIFEQLEKGNIPWRMPWTTEFPKNLISHEEYKGFNWWMLLIEQSVKGYKSNVWGTYKQISDKGGTVKKGSKSTMVIYWKILEFVSKTKKDKTGKPAIEKVPLLRYYNVFNLDQTDGVVLSEKEKEAKVNLDAESIITHYKEQIEIREGGNRAFFSPKEDYIQLPPRASFISDDEFYSTSFHEMTHSTGHEKRLNRFGAEYNNRFGDEDYSKEELIAEMGSAYMCAKTGILPSVIKNSSAYIQSWMKALKNDKTLLVSAGGKAQKAFEFILK